MKLVVVVTGDISEHLLHAILASHSSKSKYIIARVALSGKCAACRWKETRQTRSSQAANKQHARRRPVHRRALFNARTFGCRLLETLLAHTKLALNHWQMNTIFMN